MRVRAKLDVHDHVYDQYSHQGVTPGHEYDVIAIEDSYFRLAGDDDDPVLYPQYLFDVIDGTTPDYWVHEESAESIHQGPAEFAVRGFWERYHDHEPEAVELYRRIMRLHGLREDRQSESTRPFRHPPGVETGGASCGDRPNACEFVPGTTVGTYDCPATVAVTLRRDTKPSACTLEVDDTHTHFASDAKTWVQNPYGEVPPFSADMWFEAAHIARGLEIHKLDALILKFGGTREGWRSMKTWTDWGAEIHYYFHHGIGRKGTRWAGDPDSL